MTRNQSAVNTLTILGQVFKPFLRLLLAALPLLAWAAPDAAEFRARREALRRASPGALVYAQGGTEAERGNIRTGFLQDANFYYLSGWMEPGAALLVGPETDVLLLPEPDPARDRYTGAKQHAGSPDIAARTGFARVVSTKELAALVASQPGARLLASPSPAPEALRAAAGGRETGSAVEAIHQLRMIKSPAEIAMVQQAADVSIEAHKAAWRRMGPGLFEYQVAASMGFVYFDAGCEHHAYPPIVASGQNAIVLHYQRNKRRMDAGDLLLMDVGAECGMYAADITRTVPVSGRYTPRQRELYNAVLAAADAAIAAAKPGATLEQLNGIARETLKKAGEARGGKTLDNYLTHFVSHGVGLDVHDPASRTAPLEPGMIVTIEPGVYIPEEAAGIRVEDMILITRDGARNMTAALPRTARAIESFLAARPKARR